jgi:calcium-dependent protein kinase
LATENVFTEQKAAEISFEILKALHYTHAKRIAHRDIKAENLLAVKQEGKWLIKIIDWGLGAIVGKAPLGRKCGTPEYAAPEVFLGSYNQQCDMWSFGVILHVMLVGELPFRGTNFGQTMHKVMNEELDFNVKLWENVSEDAKDLVRRLLVKDPKARLTAEEAMKHRWITNHVRRQALPTNMLHDTLDRLR